MSAVSVRLALPGDADEIAFVHVESWKVAYRGQIPDDYLDALSVDQRKNMWRTLLRVEGRDETNWVAEHGDQIIGFAGAGPSRDEEADERIGGVFAIYVLASHWGTGAGATLMDSATAFLRDRFFAATLWVLDTNARARRFYEKYGWQPDGKTKDDDRGSFVLHELRYRIDL